MGKYTNTEYNCCFCSGSCNSTSSTFNSPRPQDDMVSVATQLLSQNAFGYVLPITSFVVAWLETWFLDFKVLIQEADDERGESKTRQDKTSLNPTSRQSVSLFFKLFFLLLISAYLAAVNAACERAPMIYPRAVSDGQFYSPPESVAGDVCLSLSICSRLTKYSLCVCVRAP